MSAIIRKCSGQFFDKTTLKTSGIRRVVSPIVIAGISTFRFVLVTIAHRIPTVIDSDQVLVLSDGRVAEFDTPLRLLEDKSSMFLKLVTEYSSRRSGIPEF
ncbi:ABC transporter C family member 5-like protein [Trifolium pratense]|uniref:ABC transporter C family member 5-like protein n=1 Tax=Trifolium pratense TaxID=57577 RepID=A0A2K3L7J6_TRIPR|nr:ABC transporter C family member 5-like protein [Trifolium pratense]